MFTYTSTNVFNAFYLLNGMVDLDDDVGINSFVHPMEIIAIVIVKRVSLLLLMYDADEQYGHLVSLSTAIDVENDMDDEDESENTKVEEFCLCMRHTHNRPMTIPTRLMARCSLPGKQLLRPGINKGKAR
ncbi:hypothetical protein Tco_0776463, partial [Tanacetum coccineum]